MNEIQLTVSCCHCCQHYSHLGRRGGHCNRFGTWVHGHWEACSLAHPVFSQPCQQGITDASENINLPLSVQP